MELNVYNPTGVAARAFRHAPRLDTLDGKTICELSNARWEYDRIFPAIREELKRQFPTARILPYSEVAWQRSQVDDLDLVRKTVRDMGCQAVIAGMAA